MNVRQEFEDEVTSRGLLFTIDGESGRHVVMIGGGRMLISLDNLERDVARDGDKGRISRFVDAIQESSKTSEEPLSAQQLFWCLEPSDYDVPPDFRKPLSDQVDRVLVHLSPSGSLVTWVTPKMLEELGVTEEAGASLGYANLARALAEATVEANVLDGVHLGFVATSLPFKAALILAPNLREVVGSRLGWPILAVTPDRDFLYLWAARHTNFAGRVGQVVVREYSQAPYHISTEVYEISDNGIRAVGQFPRII